VLQPGVLSVSRLHPACSRARTRTRSAAECHTTACAVKQALAAVNRPCSLLLALPQLTAASLTC
jgi:hypothetical protein